MGCRRASRTGIAYIDITRVVTQQLIEKRIVPIYRNQLGISPRPVTKLGLKYIPIEKNSALIPHFTRSNSLSEAEELHVICAPHGNRVTDVGSVDALDAGSVGSLGVAALGVVLLHALGLVVVVAEDTGPLLHRLLVVLGAKRRVDAAVVDLHLRARARVAVVHCGWLVQCCGGLIGCRRRGTHCSLRCWPTQQGSRSICPGRRCCSMRQCRWRPTRSSRRGHRSRRWRP
jgi:hypothetical protein